MSNEMKMLRVRGARADRRTANRFLELLGAMKRYVREELPPFPQRGMSEEKFRSLLGLRLLGRSQLKTLAAHDGLSASAQCIMLNRLVTEGFAERAGDPRDRRNMLYALTDSGLALLNAEIARRTDILTSKLKRLSEREKTRFARGIESVLAGVGKLRGAERSANHERRRTPQPLRHQGA
jgi:DNA-binding MarR family transcriptional regulator